MTIYYAFSIINNTIIILTILYNLFNIYEDTFDSKCIYISGRRVKMSKITDYYFLVVWRSKVLIKTLTSKIRSLQIFPLGSN